MFKKIGFMFEELVIQHSLCVYENVVKKILLEYKNQIFIHMFAGHFVATFILLSYLTRHSNFFTIFKFHLNTFG